MDKLNLQQFEFKAMGTPCALRLYAPNVAVAADVFKAIAHEIQRLEEKFSRYIPNNFLDNINKAAHQGGSTTIDEEFYSILNYANSCYENSDGLFDITSGILRKAWDFSTQTQPNLDAIEEIKASVGWKKLTYTASTIDFSVPNMELDFGGIVKEYAVDRAAEICHNHGIHHGVIDMGGDMQILGPHPDGKPWVVSIRHPEHKTKSLAMFSILKGAIASSGDYERFVMIDGERYSHILSPLTGWPVKGLSAVSVYAEKCVVAGSACTIAMLKAEKGITWLEELGVDFAAMDNQQKTFFANSEDLCKIAIH